MAAFQGMARAVGATRHVVEIKDALDGEGNVAVILEKSKVTAGIVDFGQFDYSTLGQIHNSSVQVADVYGDLVWF